MMMMGERRGEERGVNALDEMDKTLCRVAHRQQPSRVGRCHQSRKCEMETQCKAEGAIATPSHL